jgi:hypothetical protein
MLAANVVTLPLHSDRSISGTGFSLFGFKLPTLQNSKADTLKSLCDNSEIFVGRGFSHDISPAKSTRLQPLTF